MDDQKGIERLATLIHACYDIFPQFGREPTALDNARRAFQIALADFTLEQIEAAFRYWIKNFNQFPTPADIQHVVLRGNKPPFERTVYLSIAKKHGEDRTPAEWQYVRDYEKFILTGRY